LQSFPSQIKKKFSWSFFEAPTRTRFTFSSKFIQAAPPRVPFKLNSMLRCLLVAVLIFKMPTKLEALVMILRVNRSHQRYHKTAKTIELACLW